MNRLNDKQRELVSNNYGLIWKFCKLHNINKDEYSDILSIALCESVLSYDESREKIKFSTYAFRLMKNRLINEYWKNIKQRQIPQDMLVYGDCLVDKEEEGLGTILENISSMDNVEEVVLFKDMVYRLRNTKKLLTDRQKQMLDCVLLGLSNKQSQLVLNLSLKRTEQIKSDLKGRICKLLEDY